MDQFLSEIRTYAAALGVKPGTVLHKACQLGGGTWEKWLAGTASPTMRTADRIREYMRANPPAPASVPATPTEDAA